MAEKILVVDDEENIVQLINFNLKQEGYEVIPAYDGQQALEKIKKKNPDLMVLDLMLPKVDGFDICRQVREDKDIKNLPIIILSAKEEEVDKILGLELGADDYVTKPFSPRELIARVKAVLRRVDSNIDKKEKDVIEIKDVKINLNKYRVEVAENEINLTPKEFKLLSILMSNLDQVFSRAYLLKKIWGYDYQGDTRTVDVHIRRLRKKIEEYSELDYIITVRGVGYKFKDFK
ncbi:response regulator with CheY-like receiver domain and winged-helix DNA-binding domain [Halobacteroides halobius DSM 5150]|uniref:Stage 0 sporulation protein A homolog n=1 Tax=Halobacteroides halobius (strain ATCC 35273 / DSM 5150 / MD-1) TaxID=748449 RepID=L0K724_HALHC|nr:response regulator transcription factor [Halobacteroides halobius]AGB40791.1 response regulator with CheY-like receiver domain and winged-helix DNA-binding domain [Halobacteroides halobius DSM 5150]